MFSHMSYWEGIRSAGAQSVPFRHNDVHSLRQCIKKYGPGVIAIDSVYSTSGSVAPLRDIVEVSEKFGCTLIVDESHSLGTHGPLGAGMVAELGLSCRVAFRTASLAKAFAGRAGFIACSAAFADYFKYESLPAIFSSTLLPYEIAMLDATLTVIQREHWRRELLRNNARRIREGLVQLGYNINGSDSHIVSLESGSEQNTIALRNALNERGVFGSPYCAPATPANRALLRFSICAALTNEDIAKVLRVCDEIRSVVNVAEWPSTNRKARYTG